MLTEQAERKAEHNYELIAGSTQCSGLWETNKHYNMAPY